MLELRSTSVTKESSLTVNDYEYYIINSQVNKTITLITCSIRKNIDGVINEVVNIRKENRQVNSFIRDTEDYVSHIMQFAEIVKEVEKELEPTEE